MVRLDMLVAEVLGTSRKAGERLVREGEVSIAGEVQCEPRWQVVLGEEALIVLRGLLLLHPGPERRRLMTHRLLLVHKPRRCHCERFSVSGSPRGGAGREASNSVWDLVPPHLCSGDLGTFGRLDVDTTGLLLMGTDGGLQSLLMHPSSGCKKRYVATLRTYGSQRLCAAAVAEFAGGIVLADGYVCRPAALEVLDTVADPDGGGTVIVRRVCVTLEEGQFHQVKRMLGACGAAVVALHRESVGAISLSELNLAEGAVMEAGPREIELLRTMVPVQRVIWGVRASTSHRWSKLVKLLLVMQDKRGRRDADSRHRNKANCTLLEHTSALM